MKRFVSKILLYALLIFLSLEIITRVFHLYQEYPLFIINDKNVKTYAPNQDGYYVVGNRRMNFAQYHINNSGFNSYREFTPSNDKMDIALIGDSYIEGLHQNYYNSIGEKIEKKLQDSVEVFEYGHSGYDLADELHLINAYKDKFSKIDKIIIYLKFENDLKRGYYTPDQYWIDSQYFPFSIIQRNIKLFAYLNNIGFLAPLRNLKSKILSLAGIHSSYNTSNSDNPKTNEMHKSYLDNFKALIQTYGIDKNKTVFLLDTNKTNKIFLDYCDEMGYKYIDFGHNLQKSKRPTTLIYDKHWNNHGRNIIANTIIDYLKKQ